MIGRQCRPSPATKVTPPLPAVLAHSLPRRVERHWGEGNHLTTPRHSASRYIPLLSNEGLGYSLSCRLARLASSCRRCSCTMKQRLAMLLLLFLGGVFVQTAAAAALSPAQAREAMQEFTGADTNADGFLVPDEIMAMDEVRTQPTAAEVEPGSGPWPGPGPGCQGQGRGSVGPSSTRPPVCRTWCASVATSRGARRRWRASSSARPLCLS